jgi:hypothetical protein
LKKKLKVNKKNLIPLKIAGDFVFETSWGINLPLDEVFLESIAENQQCSHIASRSRMASS